MLGEFLRKCREDKGLRLIDVAEHLDKTETTISRWERGKRQVAPKYFDDLADILDCDRSELTRRARNDRLTSGDGQNRGKGGYVRSDSDVMGWTKQVMMSDHNPSVKTTLLAVAAFYDDRINASSVTRDSIVENTGFDEQQIYDTWEAVLESPWIERVGDGRWTFRLRFADDD